MPVNYAPNLPDLETFATNLQSLTHAGTVKVVLHSSARLDLSETPTDDITCSVDYFVDVVLKCGQKRRGVLLPAPDIGNFDKILSKKTSYVYKLKKSVGEQVASWYSTMTGETYTFISGLLCGAAAKK